MICYPAEDSHNQALIEWAAQRLAWWKSGWRPNDGKALAIMSGDLILAVAVYHSFRPGTMTLSLAADHPRWCTRGTIKALTQQPLSISGVWRLESLVAKNNRPARRLLKAAGFKEEGSLREGGPDHEDVMVYSLLESDFHERAFSGHERKHT